MGPYFDPYIVSWVVFLPLATALLLIATRMLALVVFDSRGAPGVVWRAVAMGSTSIGFLLALVLWGVVDPQLLGFQAMERVDWLPKLGIHYFVGVDGISLILILFTTFIVPLALLSSWNDVRSSLKSHVVLILFLETGVLGTLASLNLFQLYLFWEMTVIAGYFLIGRWGRVERFRAATKFALFGTSGAMILLLGILAVYELNFAQTGVSNFDLVAFTLDGTVPLLDTRIDVVGEDLSEGIGWQTQMWLFVAFALSCAIKMALVPFHSWLVDAEGESSTAASIMITSLLVMLGGYVYLRVALPLFPVAAHQAAPWLSGMATLGILYAALLTLGQRDLRSVVAYAALAQLGLIALGLASLTHHAVIGAVIQMVSHGLCVAALLMIFGFLSERRETRELDAYGGVAKPMPVCAVLLALALMGYAGAPLFSGFVGQFLILFGSVARDWRLALLALAGSVVIAVAMIGVYRRIMLGPLDQPANRGLIDLDWRERGVVIAALVPVIWIGIHPNPLLRRIEPPVSQLLQRIEGRVEEERERARAMLEIASEVEETVGAGDSDSDTGSEPDAPLPPTGVEP